MDHEDGNAYSRDSFLDAYGEEDGAERWEAALPEAAPAEDGSTLQKPDLADEILRFAIPEEEQYAGPPDTSTHK